MPLIDKAAASVDTAERKDIYRQIRTIVTQDAPLVFAHYETVNYLMNKNVTGSAINTDAEPPPGECRLHRIGALAF